MNEKTAMQRFSETTERLFRLSHRKTIVNVFEAGKDKYRRIGISISIVLIILLYFLSPFSRIKGISINGNDILTKDYIKKITGISSDRPFYLTIPFIEKIKLQKDPVIRSADVYWAKDNVIHIDIKEKKAVGYRYDDTPVILFDDGTTAELKSDYLDVIADIPLIKGFTDEEQQKELCRAFQDVDASIISDISEISQYSLAYDDEAICIQMREGTYFLADYYNLFTINEYHSYYANMNDKNKCLYAFSSSDKNTVFETDCPWSKSEQEYWTNDDGSPRTNGEGQPVPKHYYTLEDGSYALDAAGNKIPIPIDENGTETADADFQAHYEAGYYSTGVLVMPEQ